MCCIFLGRFNIRKTNNTEGNKSSLPPRGVFWITLTGLCKPLMMNATYEDRTSAGSGIPGLFLKPGLETVLCKRLVVDRVIREKVTGTNKQTLARI